MFQFPKLKATALHCSCGLNLLVGEFLFSPEYIPVTSDTHNTN